MVLAVDQGHPKTLVGPLWGAGQAGETTPKNESMFCDHGDPIGLRPVDRLRLEYFGLDELIRPLSL